jgi:hypothetical protein
MYKKRIEDDKFYARRGEGFCLAIATTRIITRRLKNFTENSKHIVPGSGTTVLTLLSVF